MEESYLHGLVRNVSTWKDKEDKAPGSGGHRSLGSTSLASILATLVPTAITAAIFLAIFVVIRNTYRRIYAPRTFMGTVPAEDRTPTSDRKGRKWFHDFRTLNDKFVLQHQSLDGYLFLRFFKFIIAICFVGCCITWPILFPINATGAGGASQLDRISLSNIANSTRLYAHAVVAWLFLGSVMFLVARERLVLIGIRQAYLSSRYNASRLSSRVVLFLSVPNEALQPDKLHDIFGSEAQKSWPVLKLDELESLVGERNEKAMKLESAEVQLARDANKRRLQKLKISDSNTREPNGEDSEWTDNKSRPTHRLKPIIGTKVDTISWARKALPNIATQVQKYRDSHKGNDKSGSPAVFVAFASQNAAQRACQQIQFHPQLPTKLPTQLPTYARHIGVQPKEAIWLNLTLKPVVRVSRAFTAWVFIIATIILWSIPIGIVGTISNISYLTDKVHFLRFINKLPPAILGLITGLLPPYLMSTLVSYVPKFFRYIAKLSGEPTIPQAELKTQAWYFIFQLVQVFLVTTFSSGAAAVATKIAQDPSSTPTLLARNLPKASNFYLSYFILQGTGSAAQNILNYSDLLMYIIYDRFLDKTPRDKYSRFVQMKGISWGTVYPKFTNMVVIAIAYSCIAPLVLGFATAGLFLFYLSYRYNLMYVIQTKVDSKGECYARALQHLLTGVYLSELCLIGLFGVHNAPGPSAMMVVFLVLTIVWHILLTRFVIPLETNFAIDEEGEMAPLLAAEEGSPEEDEEDPSASHVPVTALRRLPKTVSSPTVKFLESYISASRTKAKAWLHDPSITGGNDDVAPELSQEELETAYLNPALTSKTPKLWLAKDEMGISKHEIEENEAVGIPATDEGAFLDEKNRVRWEEDDFSTVPIFKKPTRSGV